MLKQIQPLFSRLWWTALIWYHRGCCVWWACVVWRLGGEWPKEIWPKKK